MVEHLLGDFFLLLISVIRALGILSLWFPSQQIVIKAEQLVVMEQGETNLFIKFVTAVLSKVHLIELTERKTKFVKYLSDFLHNVCTI